MELRWLHPDADPAELGSAEATAVLREGAPARFNAQGVERKRRATTRRVISRGGLPLPR